MASNSIGKIFRITTFGESHGLMLGGIIDGVPSGLPLKNEDIQKELDKRKPGKNKYITSRKEPDIINIVSGIFNNITTGTSIGLIIKNVDINSNDYNNLKDIFRPGHADYTYFKKYGIRDYKGGGRSSARETCIRVAAGAIAKKYLFINHNIKISGYLSQIGKIKCHFNNWDDIEKNDFFCPNNNQIDDIKNLLDNLIEKKDSIGAKITLIVNNPLIGLGDPIFDKLNATLSYALMGINGVKAIEIGDGCKVVNQLGSEHRDILTPKGFKTNHSGGIIGGISNGEPILINLFVKPTSSIGIPFNTININEKVIKNCIIKGRHDPCIGLRIIPIAEAMIAIVILDHLLYFNSFKKK